MSDKKAQRMRFYKEEAEAGSLISADYNQEVLAGFYHLLDASSLHRICDVGSGMGRNLPLLFQRFPHARLLSVDLSHAALLRGRTTVPATAPCVADGLELPLRDESVDLAICTEVLEHVADLDAALAELGRVVRPRGFCIVSSPNYLNPMGMRKWLKDRRLGKEFWDPWDGHQGFERLMTPFLVNHALRPHFEILKIRGAGFLMAWSSLGYGRIGKKNDRYPMLALGRLPLFRNLAMNRYLFLRRRGKRS